MACRSSCRSCGIPTSWARSVDSTSLASWLSCFAVAATDAAADADSDADAAACDLLLVT